MIPLPEIVYLQTITACNGHCHYCPFDDVYGDQAESISMDFDCYMRIIEWLHDMKYRGRIGFLLHCEPLLDPELEWRLSMARKMLPDCRMEIATNGIIEDSDLNNFDVVDVVLAGSRTVATSRAGNCQRTPEMDGRPRLAEPPCPVPGATFPITVDGSVLLCCQDWRHEAIVGDVLDLTAARMRQLEVWEKAKRIELDICQDCMAGRTAEEIGDRLGKRKI